MKSPSVRASALAPYALILLQNVIYGFGDPILQGRLRHRACFFAAGRAVPDGFRLFTAAVLENARFRSSRLPRRRQLILSPASASRRTSSATWPSCSRARRPLRSCARSRRSLCRCLPRSSTGKNCRKSCCRSMCSSFWARTFSVVWSGLSGFGWGEVIVASVRRAHLQARCSLGREAWTA